jgi:hypothetical protein
MKDYLELAKQHAPDSKSPGRKAIAYALIAQAQIDRERLEVERDTAESLEEILTVFRRNSSALSRGEQWLNVVTHEG